MTKRTAIILLQKTLTVIKYFWLVFSSFFFVIIPFDLYNVMEDPELYPWGGRMVAVLL